jgi:hypothetical protein
MLLLLQHQKKKEEEEEGVKVRCLILLLEVRRIQEVQRGREAVRGLR